MTKITELKLFAMIALNDELEDACRAIAAKHGVKLELTGGGKFSAAEATIVFKLTPAVK